MHKISLPSNSLRRPTEVPSWILVVVGVFFGQCASPLTRPALQWLHATTESILIPAYTTAVILYLSTAAYWKYSAVKRSKAVPAVAVLPPRIEIPPLLDEEPQPVDLTGAYKLISNDGFERILEVQGVPWALRRAANQARPTHRITHRGRQLTIKIEGIIESQTTYIINGPPVETNVRGRIFEDKVAYLDNSKGILVSKRAVTEDYDVTVQRELYDDLSGITMTSRATFRDGRPMVTCIQQFQRIK